MKRIEYRLRFVVGVVIFLFSCVQLQSIAQVQEMDRDWRFCLGDFPTAKDIAFDDSTWRLLDLPHDWAFENGYSQEGAQKDKGGYASGGIAWYRKTIVLTGEDIQGKRIFVDFDAVYMNSEVWVNGHYLGKRPYGYISFSYDLSEYLKAGENQLVVRVDNSLEPSARWYHGCGIYGSVYLRSEQHAYFEKDGIFVKTPDGNGRVNIDSELHLVQKEGLYTVKMEVRDAEGKCVSEKTTQKTVLKKGLNLLQSTLTVKSPDLWSPDSPSLYTLHLSLTDAKGCPIDTVEVRFGFRTMMWNAETGFHLNGKQLKLRGVCDHLEGGPTGAYYTEQLMRWKLQLIKDMGCNAIRTAHNPQLPMFYDLCDEMGLLVMNEIFDGWSKKADYDYGQQAFAEWWERDLRALVRRDRNHPCVFLYSVGNETGGEVASELVKVCHQEDPTRMVTSGDSTPEYMDVYGVNGHSEKRSFLENYRPGTKAFVGTENPHTWQVRGYYRTQTWYRDKYPNQKQDPMLIPDLTKKEIFSYDWISPKGRKNAKQIFNSSYDNATVRVTARHLIEYLRDKDWFSGSFRWTGFDYLGEAGYVHGGWPFRAFQGGALDLAGFPKDLYYLYQSEWSNKNMVHILPHWTHPTLLHGTEIPVWVYTNGDEVELLVNGKSMGRKRKGLRWNEMQCEWLVPWSSGMIEAIAYRNGKEIARSVQRTANAPVALTVEVENEKLKADRKNISILTISQIDSQGTVYPYGENRVFTSLCGGARVLSFESGSPVDVETNNLAKSKKCFFGLNRIFIQSTDEDSKSPVSMIISTICGDKRLTLSDKISISFQEISLRGKQPERNWKVYYTTNGEEPTRNSMEYREPFGISLKTTVKAALYDGDNKILDMEERFSLDEGLYWGVPDEPACDLTGEQAEYAKLTKCKVEKDQGEGFYAEGYVIPAPEEGSITWYQENDGGEMDCRIVVRYACQSEEESVMELSNNGKLCGKLMFPNTGSKDLHWKELIVSVTIYSGGNNIMLKSCSKSSPSIDQITIVNSN